MQVLVVGGAGYIGSHAVKHLVQAGYQVTVLDNLLTGHRKAVHSQAEFIQGDVRDRELLDRIFSQGDFAGVFHFAANSLVGESMEVPLVYFDNNVGGMITLLESMEGHGVKKIIFSSTAAVYGDVQEFPITEETPTHPTNPYGESKLMMEKIIAWCQQAYGIDYVALRYFNVAGADKDGDIGEDHQPETHLIPIILQVALGHREAIAIFGDDYPTPDGTCIRDYVHVDDLIQAHIQAFDYLVQGGKSTVFNLGSSTGYSVKEIVDAVRQVTGREIPAKIADRRPGDPASLVAASDKARDLLAWNPAYNSIEAIIQTAWNWHQKHPAGYEDK